MSIVTLMILALCFGAVAVGRRRPDLWIVGVLGRTAVVMLIVLTAWFGGLMTGVLSLDWLTHWLGTPKLERPWDVIAFLGPAVIAGVSYFLFEITRPRSPR